MTNKRKADDINHELLFEQGDVISIVSRNFDGYAIGYKPSSSQLSMIRNKKYHQLFKLVRASDKSFYFEAYGGASGSMYLFVDPETNDVLLSSTRTAFSVAVIDTIGTKQVVRLVTRDKLCMRHSNYLIRADAQNDRDKPWSEDTQWVAARASAEGDVSTAPSTPLDVACDLGGFNRPLFIHVEECLGEGPSAFDSLKALQDFIEFHNEAARDQPRIGGGLHDDWVRTKSYPLQGAGGMGMSNAGATAISMHRPGPAISDELRNRIEEATTVKSRGGVNSFIRPCRDIESIVITLASKAIREMKRLRMFGMIKRRSFQLELGFIEWVTLPDNAEIVPHRDGGNDCDVAAIVAVSNSAICNVEGTSIELKPGQMYIFEPQKYTHSVSKPLFAGPRHVLALRFFRCP